MNDILIPLVTVVVLVAAITVCVVAWFRLQAHRADAAALEAYRALAERVAEGQSRLDSRLAEVETRLGALERLLRDVG